jgi:hypothetical protein
MEQRMVKEVATKTPTSRRCRNDHRKPFLAQPAIVREGLKNVTAGANTDYFEKNGSKKATEDCFVEE